MKTLIILLILSAVSFPCGAQSTVQDTSIYYMYAELLGTEKFMSNKVNVTVDFGQDRKWFSNNFIVDPATGKARTFNSMVDAMNFMGAEGWEFTQAYVVTVGNNLNVYHWLLKRVCRRDEKGEYIPLTRAEYVKAKKAAVAGN